MSKTINKEKKSIDFHDTKRTDQMSFRNITLKVGHHTGDKLLIHAPKDHNGNQFRNLSIILIWSMLIWYKTVHGK